MNTICAALCMYTSFHVHTWYEHMWRVSYGEHRAAERYCKGGLKAWNLLEELRLLVCVCAGHQCCGEGLVISSWACVPLGAITVEWSRCLQTHARTHTHRKLKWTVSLSPHCLSASVSPWVFLSATNPAILPVWQGAFYCVFHHRLPCFWSLSVFHTSRLLDKTYESLEMCMWSLLTIDKVTEMHAALVPSQRSTFGVWVVWPEDNGQ